jgi:hypothetical protein
MADTTTVTEIMPASAFQFTLSSRHAMPNPDPGREFRSLIFFIACLILVKRTEARLEAGMTGKSAIFRVSSWAPRRTTGVAYENVIKSNTEHRRAPTTFSFLGFVLDAIVFSVYMYWRGRLGVESAEHVQEFKV